MIVRWSKEAVEDRNRIYSYILLEGGSRAADKNDDRNWYGIDSLATFPYRGRPGRAPGTRELVLVPTPFLAIYLVSKTIVCVLRILHGRQLWPPAGKSL